MDRETATDLLESEMADRDRGMDGPDKGFVNASHCASQPQSDLSRPGR